MFGLRGLRPDLEISGFETAFSEIAPALVARGHDVTIYCRKGAYSPARRCTEESGVRLRYMPSPGGKNFSGIVSTFFAVLHGLLRGRYDVWFFVNVGMGHHCALARVSGKPVVMNVDGLDWRRQKWGAVGRLYFYTAAHAAVRFCTRLVTDADAMREFYLAHFARESTMISYGAHVEESIRPELIQQFGINRHSYYLIVSRLIPENSLDVMVEGFISTSSARTLVVVGGANYEDNFQRRLRGIAANDRRVHFVGQIQDQDLVRELFCNCYAYLHGHSVGGTNPALLRAMGYGSCVAALDTVFNREVLGDSGVYFAHESAAVAKVIEDLDSQPVVVESLRRRAPQRIRERYGWTKIVDQYEALFRQVVEGVPAQDEGVHPTRAVGVS
jgi:glycosyltransferase involved in cell wall biosynthesis